MTQPIEAWSSASRTLRPEQARALHESGLVRVSIDEPPDRWRLVADSRVGVVSGDGWEVRVVPRIAIPRLMFLLGYAVDSGGWRDIAAPMGHDDDFFAAIASSFAWHAQRALEPGAIRGYVRVEETSMTVKGRLRVGAHIACRAGLPLPVEIEFDDYTIDVQENRLLAAAATRLLRAPGLPALARRRLARIRETLRDASPPVNLDRPPDTRLNAHYRPALTLAGLILRHLSVTTVRGRVAACAFVFDMNKVFEDFLSTALTASLRRRGGYVRLQYSPQFLDEEMRLRLKPDLTWWAGGTLRAVVDAKYKALTDDRFPNADAYQMLAYCKGFNVSSGTLVYAQDPLGSDRVHTLPGGVRINVRSVNLEAQPPAVLAQVEALARSLAREAGVVSH